MLAIAWEPGNFVVVPQAPLPTAAITMNPVPVRPSRTSASATIATARRNAARGRGASSCSKQGAADFRSLTKNDIGDVLLLVNYQVS